MTSNRSLADIKRECNDLGAGINLNYGYRRDGKGFLIEIPGDASEATVTRLMLLAKEIAAPEPVESIGAAKSSGAQGVSMILGPINIE